MVVYYSAEQVFSNFRSKISAKSEAFSKILNPLSGDYTLYSTVVVSVPNKNRGGGGGGLKLSYLIFADHQGTATRDFHFLWFLAILSNEKNARKGLKLEFSLRQHWWRLPSLFRASKECLSLYVVYVGAWGQGLMDILGPTLLHLRPYKYAYSWARIICVTSPHLFIVRLTV